MEAAVRRRGVGEPVRGMCEVKSGGGSSSSRSEAVEPEWELEGDMAEGGGGREVARSLLSLLAALARKNNSKRRGAHAIAIPPPSLQALLVLLLQHTSNALMKPHRLIPRPSQQPHQAPIPDPATPNPAPTQPCHAPQSSSPARRRAPIRKESRLERLVAERTSRVAKAAATAVRRRGAERGGGRDGGEGVVGGGDEGRETGGEGARWGAGRWCAQGRAGRGGGVRVEVGVD